jgi:DNA-binding SARP family transcriptional activator/ATP/maltotriose-dependent transcriptional regulator MalT
VHQRKDTFEDLPIESLLDELTVVVHCANRSDTEICLTDTMSNVLAGPALGHMAIRHRLTLVVAGAGWGKSAWLRGLAVTAPCIEVRQPPTGWTPFALAHALVDAVAEHTTQAPAVDLPAYPTADSPDRRDQFAALAMSVCTAATAITHDTLALLDDIDVEDDDSLVFLEQLVLGVPPRLHLVVACRTQPNLRIARLRAAGEVARVGTEELAVRPDDIDRFGLDPTARAAVLDIVVATGGWPLAVHLAVETSRRGGPLDRGALIEHLLSPDAILFDYLAEEVLANLSDPERDLLVLAARVPELSADLLDDIGCGDLAVHLARLTAQRIFLEPVPGRADHVRSTVVGAAFLRRALPAPSPQTIDAAICGMLRAGDAENALVLSAGFGDPQRAREVLLAIEHPDWLTAPDAIEAALAVAEQGGPHHRLTELRGNLAYQRGEWDEALRLYVEARDQHGVPTTARARKRAGLLYLRGRLDEADEECAAVTLDGSDSAEEARVLAWRAVICWARGDADGCARFVEPALESARRSGDDGALAAAYTARAMLAALQGDLPANARLYDIALGHAERSGDVAQIVRIRTNRGSRLNEQGLYSQAVAELDLAITTAELAGSDTFSSLAYNNRGEAYLALGQLDLALADLRRAHEIWTRLESNRILYPLTNMGFVQLLRGQRSEAIALFSEAIRIASEVRDAQGLAPAYTGLAYALDRDDPHAAAEAARAAIEANHAMWMPNAFLAAGRVALHSDDRAAAAEWATKATALARQRRDRPALAEALLLSANLETSDSAALAQQASRLWRDLGSPIGEARANLVLARSTTGRQRDELVAGAERMLQDAGAWGALADARIELGQGVTSSVVITTLGGFRVIRDGEPVDVGEWGSRKARDLVKLLVARRGAPVVRDEVTDLLWPEEPDKSARRLSVLLSTVRTVFDPRKTRSPDYFVAADHDTVWLVRDHVDIDVERFLVEAADGRRMLATGDRARARTSLADAAARYLGEFCADDPYADWAAGLRELAKHTFVDTCFELARLAVDLQEYSEAIRYWLRTLDVDPYDEAAHLGLVNSLRSQRRHGEARRAYRHYSAKMIELDLEPAPYPV